MHHHTPFTFFRCWNTHTHREQMSVIVHAQHMHSSLSPALQSAAIARASRFSIPESWWNLVNELRCRMLALNEKYHLQINKAQASSTVQDVQESWRLANWCKLHESARTSSLLARYHDNSTVWKAIDVSSLKFQHCLPKTNRKHTQRLFDQQCLGYFNG